MSEAHGHNYEKWAFCGFRINGSDLGGPWTATESLASVYMTEIRFVRLGKIPFYLS